MAGEPIAYQQQQQQQTVAIEMGHFHRRVRLEHQCHCLFNRGFDWGQITNNEGESRLLVRKTGRRSCATEVECLFMLYLHGDGEDIEKIREEAGARVSLERQDGHWFRLAGQKMPQ